MKRYKVYITDNDYDTLEPELAVLAKINAKVETLQCKSEDDVLALASDADALIVQYAPITAKVLNKLMNLKVIVRYGVGVDCIDIKAATGRGIVVANVPDYGISEVSDHACALVLDILLKISYSSKRVMIDKSWNYVDSKPIRRLSTLTLGIVGFGRIGRETARKLSSFGFTVVVFDPRVSDGSIEKAGYKRVDFYQLLSIADIISVHAPLYSETRHMFDHNAFSRMKRGSCIVNTARGGIIDTVALVEALQSGHLAGAGLDVVEKEPLDSDSPLRDMSNVVLTPHIAWYSEESQVDLKRGAAEEVVRVLSREGAKNSVNNREY